MRIHIVGMGSVGRRHFKIAHEVFPDSEIQVSSSREFVNAEFSMYSQNLESHSTETPSPNLVVIATPSSFHVDIANRMLDVGAHLLIEKPVSNSSQGVAQLIKKSEEKRLVMMVGYNLRYLQSLVEFRSLLDESTVGTPLSVRAEAGHYLPHWRPEQDYRETVSARKELGGGVLLELSHEIDYLRWIFGEVDWVRATLTKQSNLEINVEDTAHIVLGFSKRSQSRQLIGSLNLDFIRHDSTRNCTVIGETGTLRWDGNKGSVSLLKKGHKDWQVLYLDNGSMDESYISEWKDLKNSIELNSKPRVSGVDGLRVIEVVEAARVSAVTGQQIDVQRTLFPIGSQN